MRDFISAVYMYLRTLSTRRRHNVVEGHHNNACFENETLPFWGLTTVSEIPTVEFAVTPPSDRLIPVNYADRWILASCSKQRRPERLRFRLTYWQIKGYSIQYYHQFDLELLDDIAMSCRIDWLRLQTTKNHSTEYSDRLILSPSSKMIWIFEFMVWRCLCEQSQFARLSREQIKLSESWRCSLLMNRQT